MITESTVDESVCPGPDGEPIPLLHFDNDAGPGKLAVSFAQGRALFTTPAYPCDFDANPVMLSPADTLELGRRLLAHAASIETEQ
jgi:hypothetical protein